MSIIKPEDLYKRRKELINELTKDLSPGIRDSVRRVLEELPIDILSDRKKVFEILKKRGLIK